MIQLETPRLIIRNWEDRDRDLFHRINSDEEVMRFFPHRRTRAEADALMDRVRAANELRGYGFTALVLKATDEAIGFVGLYPDHIPEARPDWFVEIGWRLVPEHQKNGYITEAGEELLRFGFETLELPEIVSYAVHNNEPSLAVMERLGMSFVQGSNFDNPRVPDTHPHLKPHVFYALTREAWHRRRHGGDDWD